MGAKLVSVDDGGDRVEVTIEGESYSVMRGQAGLTLKDGRRAGLSWIETCPVQYDGHEILLPETGDADRVPQLVAFVSRVTRGPGLERSRDPAQIRAWVAEIRATIRAKLEVGSSGVYRVPAPGADIILVLLRHLDGVDQAAKSLAAEIAAGP